jgi:uncharacterized protein YjgD (DUF1641 family)
MIWIQVKTKSNNFNKKNDNLGLTRLQKLLNDPGINQADILVRQFTHYKDRSVLIDAIGRDIFNIILDLNDVNTRTILKMALQMGMINSNYHFVLTTLVCKLKIL